VSCFSSEEGRKEVRKAGRQTARKEGRKEGRKGKEVMKERRKEGRKEGINRRKEGRKEEVPTFLPSFLPAPRCPSVVFFLPWHPTFCSFLSSSLGSIPPFLLFSFFPFACTHTNTQMSMEMSGVNGSVKKHVAFLDGGRINRIHVTALQ